MEFKVIVFNQELDKNVVDTKLVANSKREVLLILADNLGESLTGKGIMITIYES